MKYKITGKFFRNTGFILIMAMGSALACSASLRAAQAKPAKSSSTNPVVKTDPNEWKKVVEAAKKEGKIVLSAAPGEGWRKSLVDMFHQEYPEISVELSAVPSRNFWPRIRQERGFGKKLWDLYNGGPNSTFGPKNDGILAPVRPLLLPEIADDSKWIGGFNWKFLDREKKYMFSYILHPTMSAWVNRDFIKESDLQSSAQLLDPKFRGKIVALTLTAGSSAASLSHLAYIFGENFIRELLSAQDVMIVDDNRQMVEWVVRGKYPISIGINPPILASFIKQDLGKNVKLLEDKIIRLSTGSGAISLFEGAPHPNAARVYINWLLSQKTQIKLTQNIQQNSGRTDVPPVDKETAVDPTKLSQYRNAATEEANEFHEHLLPVFKEALKK